MQWALLNLPLPFKSKYDIIKPLQRGAFGSVHQVRHKQTNEMRAAKLISFLNLQERELINYFKNELSIIKQVQYKTQHFIKLFEYFEDSEQLILIMELCDYSLQDVIDKNPLGIPIEQCINLIQQINLVIKVLHKQMGKIHRDLKGANILIKEQDGHQVIKLIDFGFCFDTFGPKNLPSTYCGTTETMAPEVKESNGRKYGFSADIYSLAVIYKSMLVGQNRGFENWVDKEQYHEFIQKMMSQDPSGRPDIEQVEKFFKPEKGPKNIKIDDEDQLKRPVLLLDQVDDGENNFTYIPNVTTDLGGNNQFSQQAQVQPIAPSIHNPTYREASLVGRENYASQIIKNEIHESPAKNQNQSTLQDVRIQRLNKERIYQCIIFLLVIICIYITMKNNKSTWLNVDPSESL